MRRSSWWLLVVAGWLVGIPVGFLLNRLLVWLVREAVNVDIPASFPPWNIVLALVGTILLALIVTALPLRPVVRPDQPRHCATPEENLFRHPFGCTCV